MADTIETRISMPSVELNKGIRKTFFETLFVTGNEKAHRIDVPLLRNGQPVSIPSGAKVEGYLTRYADDVTVRNPGTVSGNVVSVTLEKGCYAKNGSFALTIQVTVDGVTNTVFWGESSIFSNAADTVIDGDYIIYDLAELLKRIDAMKAATEAANTAATNADKATEAAETATTNAGSATKAANTAATSANNATEAANKAAGKIDNMTVQVSGLEAGATPTANLELVDGHYNLSFAISKGDKGDTGATGATPKITVKVVTGEPGTAASVAQSGTAEAPIITLTIPRGDTGSLGSLTINGKTPDSAGKVELTAADVGARADDWMPTAADVGALSGTDATLTEAGKAADAKATGDLLNQLKSEKANESIVSDAWQSGKTYAVGTYCIYNDMLYKASVQTTAEPGNGSDWVQCNVTNELVAQGNTLNNAYVKEYFNSKLDKARPITYPVVPVAGYLVIAYNYASAAIFLVRGEGTGGSVLRIAPANDRNLISCVWQNAQLNITSTDDATGIVCIIRLY